MKGAGKAERKLTAAFYLKDEGVDTPTAAAVQVDHSVDVVQRFIRQDMSEPLCIRAIEGAGENTIEIQLINRRIAFVGLHRQRIRQRRHPDESANIALVEAAQQLADRPSAPGSFIAVYARRDQDAGTVRAELAQQQLPPAPSRSEADGDSSPAHLFEYRPHDAPKTRIS